METSLNTIRIHWKAKYLILIWIQQGSNSIKGRQTYTKNQIKNLIMTFQQQQLHSSFLGDESSLSLLEKSYVTNSR